MATALENAIFAYDAYAASLANQLPQLPGWTKNSELSQPGSDGFAASVYVNGTNEVVISFRGTDSDDLVPSIVDWWNGNIPAAIGNYSAQVAQAIARVADVQAQYLGASLSFTGHSLGGGLASLMAVFFNRPAYVFDPAPFGLTALGLSAAAIPGVSAPVPLPVSIPSTTLRTYFEDYLDRQAQLNRTADSAFTQYYTQYLLGDLTAPYAQRADNVSGKYLVGEVVETFRQYIPYIGNSGALAPVDAGPVTFDGDPVSWYNGGQAMHSMRLLLAVMVSDRLASASEAAPDMIEQLTDTDLFAASAANVAPDFLTRLLKDQLIDGASVPNRALDRFVDDVTRLGSMGSTKLAPLADSLVATIMEYYHYSDLANIAPFVSTVAGGASFDVSAIPANPGQLGQNRLLDGVRELVTSGFGDLARTAADNASVWTIQSGAGGLFMEGREQSEVQIGSESQQNILYGADGDDVLISGSGNDELLGGADNDLLLGGAGDDWLNGGMGRDRLVGAGGFDYYASERDSGLDIIDGDDDTGRVVIDGTIVSGGEGAARAFTYYVNPSWTWSVNGQWFRAILVGGSAYTNAGVVTYQDGMLLLQSSRASDWVVIKHYSTGDLGLNLYKTLPSVEPLVPDPPPPPRLPPVKKRVNEAKQTTSPLVLDLDGDGVETTPISFGASFDHDANGLAEASGWVSADDGLLVRDLNGNGLIDSGRELFGNNTLLANGNFAANGFLALADLDSNSDGLINFSDATFTQLRIWRDANGNGVTDAGELSTLASSGVASVSTAYVDSTLPDAYANEHRQSGSYTNSSGQTRAVDDVWFAADTSTTVNNSTSLVSAAIAVLPDVAGTGNVVSLHQAMQADTTGHLQSLVQQYAAQTSPSIRADLLQDIIFAWTGVEALDPESRGPSMPDARVLYALEAFAGVNFVQGSGANAGTANPAANAAAQLLQAYAELAASIDSQLMEQTHLLPYLQGISVSVAADESAVAWDVSGLVTNLEVLYNTDANAAVATIASIYEALEHDPDIGPAVSMALRAAGDLNGTGLLYALAVSGSDAIVQGTEGAETLSGSSANDIIVAMGGNDAVNGGAGNDEIYGGPGNDTLSGAAGSDVYAFNRGDGLDIINNADSATARQDVIRFGDGVAPEDVTLSRSGNDLLIDIAGSTDRITVTNHFQNSMTSANAIDALQFASGSRWDRAAIGDRVLAGAATQGADTLTAFTSGNAIHGLGGNDILTGSAVRDQLYGDAGDDALSGGVGDDRLEGGTGADTLNGGAGVNTYYFRRGDGIDLIQYNFDTTLGKASMLEFGAGIVAAEIQVQRVGSDLVLKVAGTTDQIQVQRFFFGDDPGNNYSPLQLVRFADGTTWTVGDIVNALFAGTPGDDAITGTLANDTIQGQGGDDTLDGVAGDDILIGGIGDDVLDGGAGDNTYRFALGDGADTIESYYGTGVGTLELGAGIVAGDLQLTQDVYGDVVIRMAGSDSVTARGNFVGGTYGNVQFPLQQIRFADNTTLGLHVMGAGETVLDMGSAQAIAATGNTANNTITGTALSNILDGGLGSDQLNGGAGNDYYVVDTVSSGSFFDQNPGLWNFRDVVSELATDGYDSINAVNVYSAILPENVERLVITGNLSFSTSFTVDQDVRRKFIGNASDNVIDASKATGTALGVGYTMVEVDSGGLVLPLGTPLGETVIDGGSGADLIIGPTTTTRFVIDNPGDVVSSHSAITRIDTTISYVLPAGFDDLRLMGSASITATGNADDNIIDGIRNSAANTLAGGAGNDTYGVGAGDVVVEQVDGGNDTIVMFTPYSGAITYSLANYANVESFTVAWSGFSGGSTHLIGTGTDNVLRAKSKNDILDGGGGNDTLDGGTGADAMTGGTGNDLYIVDHVGDSVVEAAGEGIDSVQASVSWTLGPNVENLALTGTAPINATGNDLANVISGNSAANVLSGGAGNDWLDGAAGADSMIGGTGDDTFVVDNAGDGVTEAAGGGADTVQASISYALSADVEDLVLTGAAANGTGNSLNNTLTGTWGVNVLDGGAGADTMAGGNDGDTYVVDNIGDVIVEDAADWGTDVVLSSVGYTLSANVERLTLTGTANIDATGNGLDNVLTGNTGANHLIGGLGNDTYVVDAVGDAVTEQGGEGVDLVQSSISYVLGANLENLSLTGSAAISGTGNVLDNAISGNSAANLLDGGLGSDVLAGGAGDDTYFVDNTGDVVTEYSGSSEGVDTVVSSVSWTLAGNVEQLTLNGESAIDATGNTLANVLTGNGANNVLNGLSGADSMLGGAGDDTYVVDNTGDVVTEQASAGVDTVLASVTHTLAANVENMTLTGGVAINGTGNALDNVLTGNTGTNVLTGGAGNDTYVIQNSGDTTVEVVGGGTDAVQSSVTHTLAAEVENLTLTGGAAINATGNTLNNVLVGNAAANTLNGGAGADAMSGGAGDDTYVVDNTGDAAAEQAAEGVDLIQSSVSWVLGTHFENLTLTGSSAVNGTGNALDNVLIGNTGTNVMTGGAGDDTYVVQNATDSVVELAGGGTDLVQSSVTFTLSAEVENLTLTGSSAISGTGNAQNNVLTGNSGANTLSGGAGNDVLDGGSGTDTMVGGTGDDFYVVSATAEVITELAGEGTDSVQSSATYTLAANVENLTLTGTSAINATGNSLGNVLVGNSANNTLNGGAGSDSMAGGAGNDTYVVDGAGDVVTEQAGEGTDTIQSSVSWTLGDQVENLSLTGSTAINATGNALDNVLSGNSGANTLTGGLGNDTYVVQNATDLVIEAVGEGVDTVQSSLTWALGSNIENLTLTGSSAINGTGNSLDNVLNGNSGANTLNGGSGADTLAGGPGNDVYVIDSADDGVIELSGGGTDTVQSSISLSLSDNVENLTLTGSAALDGVGNTLDNVLTGNTAANALAGGLGNDTYVVDQAGDVVTELAGEGTDTVQSSIAWLLGANLENLTLTGSAAISGTGNALDNILTGNSGVNTLTGAAGNDTYVVQNATDTVVELAGEGTDTVQSSVAWTLGATLENLTLTGSSSISGTGNALDNAITGNSGSNTLTGNAGNDVLNPGSAGTDVLRGGAGDDTYTLTRTSGVTLSENANEGIDRVNASVTHTLAANVELLFQTGSSAINGTGNALANLLRGNTGNNALAGGGGVDILEGGSGNDTLSISPGSGLLNGGAGTDSLLGASGNDLFIGGIGNDTIATGQGADIIVFNQGDGSDTVAASTGADNTLSLGGGTLYADLLFQKSGNDLILKVGATDQITFASYYAATTNRSVSTLQVVIEGTAEYLPGGGDALRDNKVEAFDFAQLVAAFDAALLVDPNLTSWALSSALAGNALGGSDTAALGGDLAYRRNLFGTLSDVAFTPAQGILGAAGFGSSAQALQALASLQDGTPRLS